MRQHPVIRPAVAVAAASLMLALAGCGGPSAAPAPAKPTVDMEAVYLSAWHSRFPGGDDAAALKVGKDICAAYAAGTSFIDEVHYLMALAPSLSAGDAGYMIGNATSVFCPEYNSRH